MRFVVRVSIPTEKFNQYVLDGTAGQKIGRVLDEIKPEATYFTAENGVRGGYLIVNIDDPSEMPRIGEPFFLLFGAKVEYFPTMLPQDLQKAGLEQIGQKWR
jgi:hypothetical protein